MAYPRKTKDKARRLWLQGYTLDEIAKKLDMPRPITIWDWKEKEGWEEELNLIEIRAKEKRIETLSEETAKMNARHLTILEQTFAKIINELKSDNLEFNSLRDLVYSLDKAISAERLIRGEVTERREEQLNGKLEHEHSVNIQNLSDEELSKLIQDELKNFG